MYVLEKQQQQQDPVTRRYADIHMTRQFFKTKSPLDPFFKKKKRKKNIVFRWGLFLCVLQISGLNPLGDSVSRGIRQTFSCLSKLGGTTYLIRFLFGHVK